MFVCTGDGTIRTFKEEGGGSVPVLGVDFTYTGECQVIDDSNEVSGVQWRIKFLTSGVLVFTNQQTVDLFLVGGGGNGAGCSRYGGRYGSGAGGGGAGKNQGGNGSAGTANTGGGGGGGGYSSNNSNTTSGGAGGSGIAIIRKAKN